MPLLKRRAVAFDDRVAPETLAAAEQGEDVRVFQVRYTGESFDDYSAFLERIDQYRRRVYACALTGKINVTLEEALVSERKSRAVIEHFPECYHEPALRMLHHSTLDVRILVEHIIDALQDTFVVGETVDTFIDGRTFVAEVLGTADGIADAASPRRSSSSTGTPRLAPVDAPDVAGADAATGTVDVDAPAASRQGSSDLLHPGERKYYNIRLLRVRVRKREMHRADNRLPADTERTVRAKQLSRPRGALAKDTLKHFLRENATRPPYIGSPWIVKEPLATKYNLPKQLPPYLREAYDKHQQRQHEADVKEERKRRREAGEEDLPADTGPPVDSGPHYPMEDMDLSEARSPAHPFPTPVRNFALPQDYVHAALGVWAFLQAFGEPLELSPFTLDDFESSLLYDGDEACPILAEAHVALLRVALLVTAPTAPLDSETSEHEPKRRVDASAWTGDVLPGTWLDVLQYGVNEAFRIAFPSHATLFVHPYHAIPLATRLHALRCLADMALEAEPMRAFLERCDEALHEKRRERRELEAERRRAQRQRAEEEKQQRGESAANGSTETNGDGDAASPVDVIHTPDTEELPDTKSARSAKLQLQKAMRKAEEDARRQTLARAREEARKHTREHKQHLEERKQFDHEQARLQKRIDQLSEEIFGLHVQRVAPLGEDRYRNQYYFLDGVGSGLHVPGTGKLFVRLADGTWGHLSAPNEVDALAAALDTRGVRELGLHHALKEYGERIKHFMARRLKDAAASLRGEDVRRSTRSTTTVKRLPFLQYQNKRAAW